MGKLNLTYDEALELAAKVLNVDEDDDDIESLIFEKFNCDLESFHLIVDKLFPLICIGMSPLTGEWYKGFAAECMWIVKKSKPNGEQIFIDTLISYLNNKLDEDCDVFGISNEKGLVLELKIHRENLEGM